MANVRRYLHRTEVQQRRNGAGTRVYNGVAQRGAHTEPYCHCGYHTVHWCAPVSGSRKGPDKAAGSSQYHQFPEHMDQGPVKRKLVFSRGSTQKNPAVRGHEKQS